MRKHDALYELLLDYANLQIEVERILVGLNWTLCQAGATGIAETPRQGEQHYEPNVSLAGRSLAELSLWLRKWDRRQASIGLAAVNAAINSEADMIYQQGALFRGREALDNAMDWFVPRIRNHKIAVTGEVNPFSSLGEKLDVTHLPGSNGALHPATEVMLGNAEWLFVNGQSVADKTLPRILALACNARVVLYGPQVPWLEEWHDFGIDYLIGSQIDHTSALYNTIAEGGDLTSLPQAVSYRVCDLSAQQVQSAPMISAAGTTPARQ